MWYLYHLSVSVPSRGLYKTKPPSPRVIKSLIQVPRQGQETRTKNKKTIILGNGYIKYGQNETKRTKSEHEIERVQEIEAEGMYIFKWAIPYPFNGPGLGFDALRTLLLLEPSLPAINRGAATVAAWGRAGGAEEVIGWRSLARAGGGAFFHTEGHLAFSSFSVAF
ncbi:hypothetical protein Tco_0838657 [Tanacetum coccineum]|uniref:Uncharacterized protein n=1 Tax=Tanacetum coccineum TaxID=301880 RepID=A0ABQ5ANE0_9ASTR